MRVRGFFAAGLLCACASAPEDPCAALDEALSRRDLSPSELDDLRAECAPTPLAGGSLYRAQERYRILEKDVFALERRQAELEAEIRRLENELLDNLELSRRARGRILSDIDRTKSVLLAARKRETVLRNRLEDAGEDLARLRDGG
ncbi:MAG: hypothetical protein AAFR11_13260 [Pseudomonadota bacterium]